MKDKSKKSNSSNSQYHIGSVVKAAKVLNSFLSFEEGLTIPQIAKSCGMTQGTAYRFVFTLRFCGFIEEDQKTGTFRLGKALFPLANKVLNQDSFLRFSRPEIQALAEETRCNSSMGVLFNGLVLYVARVDSQGSRNTYTLLGRMAPIHCTALGKTLISELSIQEIEKIVPKKDWEKYTDSTLLDLDNLLKDLELVRKRGYALDLQERMQGVCCVAAPVRDADGKVIAALSVSSRLSEFLEKGEETLAHAVIYHANRISSTRGNQNGYL